MIRVLQIVGGLRRAGTETWLLHVARRLTRSDIRMDFLVHGDERGEYEDELRELGCEVIHAPMPRHFASYCKCVSETLRTNGYAVVHSHLQHFSGLTTYLAYRSRVPIRIVHSHLDAAPGANAGARAAYSRFMTAAIARYATHQVAVSRRAASALFGRDWANSPRTTVVSCGIDVSPFKMPVTPGVRESLGLRPDGLVIGHIGRFVDQKNHTFLIRVAAEAMARDRSAQLLLVGEGPLRRQIEIACGELGILDRTVFAGSRGDIPALLKSAFDVFLFPSLYEGLGLAAVEAQAAGVPCVIADVVPAEVEVLSELIHWQSLDDSPAEWADAVLKLAQLRGPHVDAAHRVERTEFNIDRSVSWLTDAYSGRLSVGLLPAVAG